VRTQSGGAGYKKLASGSTRNARFIRGMEHGDARFATASLSDQHPDALQKKSGYRMSLLITLLRGASRLLSVCRRAGLIAHERFCGHCADT
jgi:hypothetical protein